MTSHTPNLPRPLAMPQGLLAWVRSQGPDMWHEFSCGVDFASPQATIDLLMAAQWISRQPDCCRATALLLLARLVQAGIDKAAPPQMAPEAARVMVAHLHRRLAEGRFDTAMFRLTMAQETLVVALFGANGAMPLPASVLTWGRHVAQPPHAFLGWRPAEAAPVLTDLGMGLAAAA